MRLGTLCEEMTLTDDQVDTARSILSNYEDASQKMNDDQCSWTVLAKRFWYLASLRDNSMAQSALADQLMFEATASEDGDKQALAVALFVLAAQQGYTLAVEALSRCIEWEADHAASKEAFLQQHI